MLGLNVSHFQCVGSFKITLFKAKINSSMQHERSGSWKNKLDKYVCVCVGEQCSWFRRSVSDPLLMKQLSFCHFKDLSPDSLWPRPSES